MPVKEYKQVQPTDPEVSALQSNLRDWALQFPQIEILQGRLLKDIDVTTAQTTIDHGLGRKINGWIVVANDTDSRLWEISRTTSQLVLDTSANTTISLWVF